MWAKSPIPRNDFHQTGKGYAPPCEAFGMPASMCQGMEDGSGGAEPTLEIVDHVMIPEGIPPGDYVLGWRCGPRVPFPCLARTAIHNGMWVGP